MSVIRSNRNIYGTNYCFTLNNPQDIPDLLEKLKGYPHTKYCVFQLEKASTGTEHLQGYLELKRAIKFSQLLNFFKPLKPHIEKRKGTPSQARDYCMKEDTRVKGPWEIGTFTAPEPGKRSDILNLYDDLKEGQSNQVLLDNHPVAYMRYYKAVQHVRTLTIPPMMRDIEVVLHYGKPGTGKTYDVVTQWEDLFIKPMGKSLWFDGYFGQNAILIDDFSGQCTLVDLLRLLDKYRLQVEIKGGHTWVHATKIFLTTNIHPSLWYKYEDRQEQFDALKRRFHKVYVYEGKGKKKQVTIDSFFKLYDNPDLYMEIYAEDTEIEEESSNNDISSEVDMVQPRLAQRSLLTFDDETLSTSTTQAILIEDSSEDSFID